MSILASTKKLFRKVLCKLDRERYLSRYGFKHGKNFHNFSPQAIDVNWPWLISVGDNVIISFEVRILAHDSSVGKVGVPTKVGCVTIGNNVFIGAKSIVLCDTRIGDNVIIGAGSVVSKDVPSNSVVAGNPARYICSLDEFALKHKKNREERPKFAEHAWDEWIDASEKEKDAMRELLSHGYGYLK